MAAVTKILMETRLALTRLCILIGRAEWNFSRFGYLSVRIWAAARGRPCFSRTESTSSFSRREAS